ncbi:hypothetical protein QTN25_002834 [Entamoeba marina]
MSLPENNYYLTITNTDNSEFNPIVKIPKAYTLYIKCNIPYVKIIVEQQNSQEFCELYTVTKLIQREVNDVKEQKIIFKLRPLVAGHNDYGKFNYAFCIYEQNGLPDTTLTKNDGKNIIFEMAKNGFSLAQSFRANNVYSTSKNDAVYFWARAVIQSEYSAMNNLATCLWSGSGVGINSELAFKLFKIAAKNDSIVGQVNLAGCYHSKKLLKPSNFKVIKCCRLGDIKSIKWFERALSKCDENEKANIDLKTKTEKKYAKLLKTVYYSGYKKKYGKKALNAFEELKKKGDSRAYYDIGTFHYKGYIAIKRRLRLEDNQINKANILSTESRKEIFDLFINIDQQQLLDMTYLKEQVSYIRSICKNVYLKHNKKDIGPDIAAFLIRVPNTVTKICSRIEDEERNATKPKARVGCPVKIDRDVLKKIHC